MKSRHVSSVLLHDFQPFERRQSKHVSQKGKVDPGFVVFAEVPTRRVLGFRGIDFLLPVLNHFIHSTVPPIPVREQEAAAPLGL
ncbi:MAG: hypothetical protein ACRD1X_14690 [Vicinamibacteria bacterium]